MRCVVPVITTRFFKNERRDGSNGRIVHIAWLVEGAVGSGKVPGLAVLAVETQPRSQDAVQGNGGGVRTRSSEQSASLQVRECGLGRASG